MTPQQRDMLQVAGIGIAAAGFLYMMLRPATPTVTGQSLPVLLGSAGGAGAASPQLMPVTTYSPGSVNIPALPDVSQPPLINVNPMINLPQLPNIAPPAVTTVLNMPGIAPVNLPDINMPSIPQAIMQVSNPGGGGGCCNATQGSQYVAPAVVPVAQPLATPLMPVDPQQNTPLPPATVVGNYSEYNGPLQFNYALMSDGSSQLLSQTELGAGVNMPA